MKGKNTHVTLLLMLKNKFLRLSLEVPLAVPVVLAQIRQRGSTKGVSPTPSSPGNGGWSLPGVPVLVCPYTDEGSLGGSWGSVRGPVR